MRVGVPIALVVFGVCLILGPLLANAYTNNRDKDRIAEFYSRNGSAVVLPNDMHPSGYTAYDFGCFFAGVAMGGVGVMRSRSQLPEHLA
jgi:hypothetical protein